MSRIGNKVINIPEKVKVNGQQNDIAVEGPKGKLAMTIDGGITCELQENNIEVKRGADDRKSKALHGLYRSLLNNLIVGVSEGFKKDLLIEGVGYKAQMKGKAIAFDLGFSHQIQFSIPEGITVKVNTPTSLTVEGIDKQLVGQVAAHIRALRKPEPYKGKGIRYATEQIRRKQGKKVG